MNEKVELDDVIASTGSTDHIYYQYDNYEEIAPKDSFTADISQINKLSDTTNTGNNNVYEALTIQSPTVSEKRSLDSRVQKCNDSLPQTTEEKKKLLKRLHIIQVISVVLGVLLVATSVTLGVVQHLSKTRIEDAEKLIGALQMSVDNLQTTSTQLASELRSIKNQVTVVNQTLTLASVQIESGFRFVDNQIRVINQTVNQSVNAVNHSLTSRISDLEVNIRGIPTVGFTVREKSAYVNGILRFRSIATEVGGGFNHTTGVFTAPHSGLYLVSVTLQLENDGNMICKIYRNGITFGVEVDIIGTRQEPGTQTVVMVLYKGNTVHIGDCSNENLIGEESTFTVALLKAT